MFWNMWINNNTVFLSNKKELNHQLSHDPGLPRAWKAAWNQREYCLKEQIHSIARCQKREVIRIIIERDRHLLRFSKRDHVVLSRKLISFIFLNLRTIVSVREKYARFQIDWNLWHPRQRSSRISYGRSVRKSKFYCFWCHDCEKQSYESN